MRQPPPIPNLDSLVALGSRDGVDIRPTLLRVTTDLYVAKDKHSADEERQYIELALRLIGLVDADTREIVTAKLQAYPGAPEVVLRRLLGGEAAVPAAPVAQTPEAANETTADGARRTAAHDLNELFFSADVDERRLILIGLDHSLIAPAAAIPALDAAETVQTLELSALSHNAEGFAKELERALGISREQARRIIADESGEPLLIAAIALGMPEPVLQRVLLCLNPAIAQSVQRVYELASLHQEIDPQSALRMIALWQAMKAAEAPARPASVVAPAAPRRAPEVSIAVDRPARPTIRWEEHAKNKSEG